MDVMPTSSSERQSPVDSVVARRLAVVLHKGLSGGVAANVAAIVVGGLRCHAFSEPVKDLDGNRHASIMWNMPVLRAKTNGQLCKVLGAASGMGIEAVAFCEEGRSLSNSFREYSTLVSSRQTENLTIIGIALFGEDSAVRELTRSFSLYQE